MYVCWNTKGPEKYSGDFKKIRFFFQKSEGQFLTHHLFFKRILLYPSPVALWAFCSASSFSCTNGNRKTGTAKNKILNNLFLSLSLSLSHTVGFINLYPLSFVKFNLVIFQDILIHFVIELHLSKWKEGWVEYIEGGDLYPMMELCERFMIVKGFLSTQMANPSISSLCHCLISFCHIALLQCSIIVSFGMFQLTGTFTNEILTKGEVKRFSPSKSEFRNLSFLITADDISGV